MKKITVFAFCGLIILLLPIYLLATDVTDPPDGGEESVGGGLNSTNEPKTMFWIEGKDLPSVTGSKEELIETLKTIITKKVTTDPHNPSIVNVEEIQELIPDELLVESAIKGRITAIHFTMKGRSGTGTVEVDVGDGNTEEFDVNIEYVN